MYKLDPELIQEVSFLSLIRMHSLQALGHMHFKQNQNLEKQTFLKVKYMLMLCKFLAKFINQGELEIKFQLKCKKDI